MKKHWKHEEIMKWPATSNGVVEANPVQFVMTTLIRSALLDVRKGKSKSL